MALSFFSQFAQDATTDTVPTDITTEISPELQNEITNQLNDNLNNVTTTSTDTGILAGIGITFFLIYFAIILFFLICYIKIFIKAGRKWWEAIIPIYNIFIMLKIIGRPAWWILLFFIPFVNIVVSVIVAIDLAKAFGKDEIFGVLLLWLFGFIGYPMLAFGSAKYVGPLASDSGSNDANTPPTKETAPPPPAQPTQTPPAAPTNLVQ